MKSIFSKRGSALIIVLGVIAVLIAITVGFLMRVSTERTSAASYAHAAGAARLAETAVQLVQGQIEYAATQGGGTTWISQPGMARTYTGPDQLDTAYKLYSAREMTSSDNATLLTDDLPPSGWADSPAEWTDLNAPVISDGNRYYPILNPAAQDVVPGFSVKDADWKSADALPMPVRWLYVLAEGQVISPSSVSGKLADFSASQTVPTKDNPIVGRIAFWTDDESSKVNVNTAGAPTFFDLPWYNSTQEQSLADTQPIRNEFQRYPGHPATVDLTSVVAPLLEGKTQREIQAAVLDLAPRLQEGGSLYGTRQTHKKTGNQYVVPAITLDRDRLYPSSDEVLYQPSRTANGTFTSRELDILRFFLTAHSRAPELNPFGLPKVAMWPLHTTNAATHRTPYEMLISRASSINGLPYFFQRANSRDPESDWKDIERNRQLFSYLDDLFSQNLPGVGASLASKFGDDRRQILAQILDYIRSTNLYDDYLPIAANRFTRARADATSMPEEGHGFVAPLKVTPDGAGGPEYMGFGRFQTLSELAFLFICNADGYDDTTLAAPSPYPLPSFTNSSVTTATRPLYENHERKRSRYGPGYVGTRDPTTAPDNKTVPAGTMLTPDERIVQMMILPELFSPMYGYVIMRPDMSITISGLQSIQLNGVSLFPNNSGTVEISAAHGAHDRYLPLGGAAGFRHALVHTRSNGTHVAKGVPARGPIPADANAGDPGEEYPFVSIPLALNVPVASRANATMLFSTGTLTVEIFYGTAATGGRKLVQTITIGATSASIPVPNLVAFPESSTAPITKPETWWGFHAGGVAGHPGRISYVPGNEVGTDIAQFPAAMIRGSGDPVNTGAAASATGRHTMNTDVIRSFVPKHGDYRLVAARPEVPAGIFTSMGNWGSNTFLLHTLRDASFQSKTVPGAIDHFGKYRSTITSYGQSGTSERNSRFPDFPATSTDSPNLSGDYDKGAGYAIDGPYINKADEGNVFSSGTGASAIPYFHNTRPEFQEFAGEQFFSPNRVIPSPGMLGSLPTHVLRGEPWRTLLFRPQTNHPNWSNPKDHLVMEFFWMPVVEPYAISEPFSTAGKINMNYQIMPFTWLERSTGLRAALSEERLTAAPTSASECYNLSDGDQTTAQHNMEYRRRIDMEETLLQFEDRFDAGKPFLSASEICDLQLVPEGQSLDNMDAFWSSHSLTSDNVRERVYATLYPKLTVRSNIFTVHFKAQALRQRPGGNPEVWTEGLDQVVAEYRGSTTIERFIDPNDASIPDYPSATDPLAEPPASAFYRWRTIRNLPFSP
jgi:uncharacterized protein (TIGR02600 family)